MTRLSSTVAVVLLAVWAAVACAPPADPDVESAPEAGAAVQVRPDDAPAETGEGQSAEGDADAAPEGAAPRATEATTIARRVVYQQLRGGVFVPRCAECGETQPEGATICAGCGQALVPWRHESVCPSCAGSGSCERCGDDRPCLECAATGACAACDGEGRRGAERCDACRGRGVCQRCRGDGVRSSVLGDFAPGESYAPGICTTCVDGAGLCPTCATGDEECPTCAGSGRCPDCDGTSACRWDRGDGLCATCDGSGREIVNGPAGTPADRSWRARRSGGEELEGRVAGAPSPDLSIIEVKNGKERLKSLVPQKVDPVSYYMAARDFTALDDAHGRAALAAIAADRGMLTLALRELRRAADLDAAVGKRLAKRTREISTLRAQDWRQRAETARQQGDRDAAALLYAMVPSGDPGSAAAVRVALDELKAEVARELAGLDADARALRERAANERLARTVQRARDALALAQRRLSRAHHDSRGAQRVRLAFAAADHAAQLAERLIHEDARLFAWHDSDAWPEPPAEILENARIVRGRITYERAVEEVAGGRFALGRRLAWIARDFGAEPEAVQAVLKEAERGMMRRGVRLATPPPEDQ